MSGIIATDRRLGRGRTLARNWWAVALRGVVALVFGLFAFLSPGVTAGTLVLLFGAYLFVDGAFATVAAIRALTHHERWGELAMEGVLGILIGLVALALPALALVVWVSIMGAWAIVTGVLMLLAAFRSHAGHGNWLLGLGGAASLVWGAMLFAFPIAGAVVLTIWLGAYAVIFGVTMIALAVRLRATHAG